MNTLEKVINIVAEQLAIVEDEVLPDSLIQEELGANSLDKVQMIIAFEDEFKIVIHDADAMRIKTAQDAANAIDERIVQSHNNALSL